MTGLSRDIWTCELGTDDIPIADMSISEELNQIPYFSFNVANTTQHRALIDDNIASTVHIYRNDVEVFTGRIDVDKIRYTISRIYVTGYDSIIGLHFDFYSRDQSQYDVRRVQFSNIAANTILGYVLTDAGGYTTSECPSTNISLRGEYATHIEWISAVAKACKWTSGSDKRSHDWWIDTADAVHIAQQRGTARGTLSNITLLENTKDYARILNTAYGKGDGDGINQLTTVKINAASVTTYGTRSINRIDRRFQVQASLDDEMEEFADDHANPVQTIKCDISTYEWFDMSLSIGDTVTIENTGLSITSASYRIMKVIIGVEKTMIDIVNIIPTLTSGIQDVRKDVDINGGYMQGATNIWQVGPLADNYDPLYPVKLDIHIPSEAVYINRVKLNWKLSKFRGMTTVTDNADSGGLQGRYDESSTGLSITGSYQNVGSSVTPSAETGMVVCVIIPGAGWTSSVNTSFKARVKNVTDTLYYPDSTGIERLYVNGTDAYDCAGSAVIILPGNFKDKELQAQIDGSSGIHNINCYWTIIDEHAHNIGYSITEDSDNSPKVFADIGSTPVGVSTLLDGNHTDVVTTITVDSTTGFASSGTIKIGTEQITYTGTTGTTFTGCTRGANGTANTAHTDNDKVSAPYTGDQTAIDVTDDVSAGWNTLTLTPTARGRIQVDGVVQVFIRSE